MPLGIYQWPGMALPNPIAPADIHPAGTGPTITPAPPSLTSPQQPPQATPLRATPTFAPGSFGDALLQSTIFGAPGSILALPRPVRAQRTLLIIANNFPAQVIYVNYDNPASPVVGVPIGPGGNMFLDTVVPQNDIYIFSPVAGVVPITYINIDATNPSRVLTNVG